MILYPYLCPYVLIFFEMPLESSKGRGCFVSILKLPDPSA